MKPSFASFSTPPLGFKHVIDYEQNSAVWEHVCHEGFQRKKQPAVVLDMFQGDSTCKSIDGCCLSSILSCSSTSMFTCLLSKHCREPRAICIHWKRIKREQAQNTLPGLAKKFAAIFKFRPLSITFGFTF